GLDRAAVCGDFGHGYGWCSHAGCRVRGQRPRKREPGLRSGSRTAPGAATAARGSFYRPDAHWITTRTTRRPTTMAQTDSKLILSLRDVRLASTAGHVIRVKKNTPTRIPKALYVLAAQNGCVDYNPQMIEAFKAALAQAEGTGDAKADA